MEPQKVVMLYLALADKPELRKRLQDDEEWWQRLERTPESQLDEEQKRVVGELSGGLPLRGE